MNARYNVVGHGYFSALRIPLLSGREFERRDRSASEPVAIVNETMAARLGDAAIGQTLRLAAERLPRRIVGVVRDVKYNGITESRQPYVYLPLSQAFRRDVSVHLRTHAPAADMLLRNKVRVIDPNLAVSDMHTFSEQLDKALHTPRMSARMSGVMASIAAFLAIVGVYGLLAASVDQRKRELSIRTALGATPRDLVKLVALEGVRLTGLGLVAGMVASFAGSGLLAALLYGVRSHDPLVFALVPLAILTISVAASVAPARRAAGAEPVAILKAN